MQHLLYVVMPVIDRLSMIGFMDDWVGEKVATMDEIATTSGDDVWKATPRDHLGMATEGRFTVASRRFRS